MERQIVQPGADKHAKFHRKGTVKKPLMEGSEARFPQEKNIKPRKATSNCVKPWTMDSPWPWTVHGHGQSMAMDGVPGVPGTLGSLGPRAPEGAPMTIQEYHAVYYTRIPLQYYTRTPHQYYTRIPHQYYTSLPRQYLSLIHI